MKLKIVLLVLLGVLPCLYYGLAYNHLLATQNRGIVVDLYPTWNAGHAVLQGRTPYSDEVTEENELAADGRTYDLSAPGFKQRYPYPLFAVFMVLPLALLPYPLAKVVTMALFLALAPLCVYWTRGRWDSRTVLAVTMFFSFYPLIYCIQSCQPTILYLALITAALAGVRNNHVFLAAILCAVALGKPQLSIPIVLAIALYTRSTKFIFWLAGFLSMLTAAAFIVDRNWVAEWLSVLHAYASYNRPSLLVEWFGSPTGRIASAIVGGTVLAILWVRRNESLLFLASVATLGLFFVFPYQTYNAACLVIPALWAFENIPADSLAATGLRVALATMILGNMVGVLIWPRFPIIAAFIPYFYAQAILWSLVAAVVIALRSPGVSPLEIETGDRVTATV